MSNSTNVVPFVFEGNDVRVVEIEGAAWFVAKDIATVLGYTNPQKAVRDHCKTVVSLGVNDSFTLDPQTKIIEERDIYRLVMRSKLPSAERFEEWVVGEVLPSIRQHGGYIAGQNEMDDDELLARAVLHAQSVITQKNALIAQQQQTLTAQEPMVNFFNSVGSTNTLMSMTQAVKTMNIQLPNGKPLGRNEAFSKLRNQGILQTTGSNWNLPYQVFINQGYFKVKTTVLSNGQTKTVTQVTGKGLQWLYDKLK